jgi:hypothetical protein
VAESPPAIQLIGTKVVATLNQVQACHRFKEGSGRERQETLLLWVALSGGSLGDIENNRSSGSLDLSAKVESLGIWKSLGQPVNEVCIFYG